MKLVITCRAFVPTESRRKEVKNTPIIIATDYGANFFAIMHRTVNDCFQHLEDIALSKGLRLDVINEMRSGWTRDWEKARMSLEQNLIDHR